MARVEIGSCWEVHMDTSMVQLGGQSISVTYNVMLRISAMTGFRSTETHIVIEGMNTPQLKEKTRNCLVGLRETRNQHDKTLNV